MNVEHEFLHSLALVLCVAAVTTVLFQKLRQPVVLGYLVAGLIIGPHVPVPLVADPRVVHTLAELGVILLMFAIGLEFSLRRLFRLGPTVVLVAVVEISLMLWLGHTAARLLGWSSLEGLYASAMLAISSTTIIAKAFPELQVGPRLRDLVFGILIVEDLVAILLLTGLTTLSSGGAVTSGAFAGMAGDLLAFIVGLCLLGLWLLPRAIRSVVRLNRPETTLVASIGVCFALALLAQSFGYSVALGAFLAGVLIAESGEAATVEHLVTPVKDTFAAVFFVAVGMLIEPSLVWANLGAVVLLAGVVVGGKIAGVFVGGVLTGQGVRTSVQAGMSLAQIGEFSFLIAGLGLTLDATGKTLFPVAVAVSALTTLTTPWLIRLSEPVSLWVDRKLPHRLQTFLALYGAWLEPLRDGAVSRSRVKRLGRWLLADAAVVAFLAAGVALRLDAGADLVRAWLPVGVTTARAVVGGAALVLSVPFLVGIARCAVGMAGELAHEALPADGVRGGLPRRVLAVTLQLFALALVALLLLALTLPFVPVAWGVALACVVFTALAVAFWRNADRLQDHVQAGSEHLVEALLRHTRTPAAAVDVVPAVFPGLGQPEAVAVQPESPAVGRTLADLNLRGRTGATVLAIRRGESSVVLPTGHETLTAGDVLAVAGTVAAIAAAREALAPAARSPA